MKLISSLVLLLTFCICTAGYTVVERLTNGGFESGLSGWITGTYGTPVVVTSGTYGVVAEEGSHFLDARLSDYTGWPKSVLTQSTVLPQQNAWYEVTGLIYPHLSAGRQASITIDWGDGTIERLNPSIDSEWNWVGYAHYTQFSSPNPVSVYLEIYGDPLQSGEFVLFDDISIMDYSSSVPEPTSAVSLAVFAASLIGTRQRRGRVRR